MIFGGKALGAIEAVNSHRLDAVVLKFLTTIADFAAIAVENTRRYGCIHDLTGLYNTRYLYSSLQEMVD